MEADEYRKLAAVEDGMWYFHALHAHMWRELAGRIPEASEVLDAGCGTGGLARRLAPRRPRWRWTGVDVSPLALELAARRTAGSGMMFHPASVAALPLGDNAFDAVVSADVLYHVEDDRAALREFHRVLRPGGVVVINVPAYPWLWSYHDEAVQSQRRYRRAELVEKIRRAGFELERATHWNALPLPLVVLRRKLLPPPRSGSDVTAHLAPVECAFRGMMAAERAWLAAFGSLPFGSSILAVATKPQNPL